MSGTCQVPCPESSRISREGRRLSDSSFTPLNLAFQAGSGLLSGNCSIMPEPSTCLRTRVVLGKKHDLAVEDHVGIAVTEATREFGGRAGYRRVLSVGEQNDGVARYSTQGDVAADDPHLVEHVQATRPSSRQFDEVEAMCNRGFGQQVNQVISGKANSETSDAKWCSHTVLSSGVTGAYSGIEETLSCLPECEAPPRRKVLE